MNAFLVRTTLVAAVAISSAIAVAACTTSTTTNSSGDQDSGTPAPKKDGGGTTPVDSGDPQPAGACGKECATSYCAKKSPTQGDACDTCLDSALSQGGACAAPVDTACAGNTDCVALMECFAMCDPDAGAPDGSPDSACVADASASDCATCCIGNHTTGANAIRSAMFDCACGQ